ncbi:serine hydrolase domain-containing protein [Geothrix terrae]|uniref:serine hydrolase domain-containing protein n=1 Tax=Geothrix terrae TaxID=2922720 RepID=UPI001FAD6F73|nr:beta-lactamase family protein [Geothrix terrae]
MDEAAGVIPFYDLASLAKPLVTAPLALAFLDLDADRRWALGFHDREAPLTARQLLSHSSGLPPWRPFTGEPLAAQLRRPVPDHPLLRPATPGQATYSDLNYRLLAELVEAETRVPFRRLGSTSGLSPAPWPTAPVALPDAPDAEAWRLATERPLPPQDPRLPQDANARAGMPGHAGFGATAPQLKAALARWVAAGWPERMAVETAPGEGGSRWGLGLQALPSGGGRFGQLLSRLPAGLGLQVLEEPATELPPPAPALDSEPGPLSGWWFHLGYTGPALFYRPTDEACVALLLHRSGPAGTMLDMEALRARRWQALSRFVGQCGG